MGHSYRLAVWASGSGTNAEKLFERFSKDSAPISTQLLVSNRSDAPVCERAKKHAIPVQTFSNTTFDTQPQSLLKIHREYGIDWIVLAGFLRKVHPILIQAYPHRILNIHPSLLPKYGGKGMYGMRVHAAVLANKESKSGISIHYVNEAYDAGAIVFSKSFALSELENRRVSTLAKRVQELEHKYYPQIVQEEIKRVEAKGFSPAFEGQRTYG